MADYPSAIFAKRTRENKNGVVYDADKTTILFTEDIDKGDLEITAIETELGTLPKGAFGSVKLRLEDIEADTATIPVKATGAEIDTGTNDTKFVTPKAVTDSTILKKSGGILTGEVDLGENAGLKLDSVLSGDEKYSGIVESGTAGATLAVGDLCYLKTADGQWYLTDGILDGTDVSFGMQLGICILAANDNGATKLLVYGKIRSAAFPAFTVGAPVYMDDTAGDMVVAQPSTANFAIRKIGYAITAEDLFFQPSDDYIVHV